MQNGKVRLNIVIPKVDAEKLEKLAKDASTSRTQMLVRIFQDYINAKETIQLLSDAISIAKIEQEKK